MLGVMGQTKNVAVENSNLRKSVTLESSYHYLSGKVACIARNWKSLRWDVLTSKEKTDPHKACF